MSHTTFQLAMDLALAPSESLTEVEFFTDRSELDSSVSTDHFVTKNGITFAGTHLILDLWGAQDLDDLQVVEQAMRDAVAAAEATLLHIHLHHFTPNGGISGVAVLAESHISIHTWPERGYAALDIFMCGDARPERAIPVLEAAFRPARTDVSEYLRGRINPPREVGADADA
jgi:S-adenosylmethionine decarboxylase